MRLIKYDEVDRCVRASAVNPMIIERLPITAWRRLKSLRERAVRDSPDAFGSTLAEILSVSQEQWIEQLEKLPTFVACEQDADIGMARVSFAIDSAEAWLRSMWVAPDFLGRRVGEQLAEAAIALARDRGCTKMFLEVADHMVPAISLYKRLGFDPTGYKSHFPCPRAQITEHRRALVLKRK